MPAGMWIATSSLAMRRGGWAVMCFSTSMRIPRKSRPRPRAWMPRIVWMHAASAVATRSVGENDSPLPWLSTGASVMSSTPEGPCVARTRRSPR